MAPPQRGAGHASGGDVHHLEEQEAALERRTRSLELSGPLTQVFSLLALALSIAALVVAR